MDCNVKENHELSYQNVQQRESDQEAQGDRLYLRMRKWSKILHSGKKLGMSEAGVGSSDNLPLLGCRVRSIKIECPQLEWKSLQGKLSPNFILVDIKMEEIRHRKYLYDL